MLHVATTGSPSGTYVTLIHGFTQTGAAWQPVIAHLDHHGLRFGAIDAPGHGRSSHVAASLWHGADLIAQATQPGIVIGYSMGARYALHLALSRPSHVHGLVLISGTAGIADPDERTVRRASDETLAQQLLTGGLSAFLDRWLALPMFATLPAEAADRTARMTNTAAGLAASLRTAGTGSQESLWGRLGELATVPTLMIAGELDRPYAERATMMHAALEQTSSVCIVAGSGHACHLEQPTTVAAAISDFIDGLIGH